MQVSLSLECRTVKIFKDTARALQRGSVLYDNR